MFPGKEATIETRCPTTGTPITVRIKDGEILDLAPRRQWS
jgi:Alkylmercury lyase